MRERPSACGSKCVCIGADVGISSSVGQGFLTEPQISMKHGCCKDEYDPSPNLGGTFKSRFSLAKGLFRVGPWFMIPFLALYFCQAFGWPPPPHQLSYLQQQPDLTVPPDVIMLSEGTQLFPLSWFPQSGTTQLSTFHIAGSPSKFSGSHCILSLGQRTKQWT